MWVLTAEAKAEIDVLYQYFLPLIEGVSKKELYDRIYGGYCYGEGIIPLTTVKVWEGVFGIRNDMPVSTVFSNWDDYRKYKGDWHRKLKSPTDESEWPPVTSHDSPQRLSCPGCSDSSAV